MAFPNIKNITIGIETILTSNLAGTYIMHRNPQRNNDPNKARQDDGWIGIYSARVSYTPHTTGSTPWLAAVGCMVELQCASANGDDAENALETGVQDILTSIWTDRTSKTLNNTIALVKGFDVEYERNEDQRVPWWYSALITIKGEVRA